MAILGGFLGLATLSTVAYVYRSRQLRLKVQAFESQLDEISMRANGELPETIESNYVNPTYEVAPAVMINTLLTESNLDGGAGRAYVAGYKHQQPHDFHNTLAQATASGEAPSMHGGSTYANGEETPVRRRESAAPTARN